MPRPRATTRMSGATRSLTLAFVWSLARHAVAHEPVHQRNRAQSSRLAEPGSPVEGRRRRVKGDSTARTPNRREAARLTTPSRPAVRPRGRRAGTSTRSAGPPLARELLGRPSIACRVFAPLPVPRTWHPVCLPPQRVAAALGGRQPLEGRFLGFCFDMGVRITPRLQTTCAVRGTPRSGVWGWFPPPLA